MRLFGFFDDGDDDDRSRSSSSSSCSSSSSSDDSNIGGNTGNHFLSEIHDFDHLNMADFLLDLGILDDLFGILEPFEDDEEEESYDSDFSEQEKEDMRGRGPRKKRKKRDPYNAPFYKTYIKPADQQGPDVADSIWDETSGLAKSFCQRFGLPWIHFNNIYEDWNRDPDGEYRADKSRNGTPRIDARILMMGTFAILTQDMTFDWMDLVSDTSKSINHRFFHKFIWWFKNHYLEEWIRFPNDEASLKKVMDFYGILGLPGCVGSVDCVHIGWDCCPAGNRSNATGKEGYPTLSFVQRGIDRTLCLLQGQTWKEFC